MNPIKPLGSSYRDNDGFVFEQGGLYYRLIKPCYFPHYQRFMKSGLYTALADAGRLVAHKEIDKNNFDTNNFTDCKIILPEQIPFISYPYEWSFNMWQDAAITTLKIASQALEFGMFLKDATPFNIQFTNGRPVFIDTLSFENYELGKPWIAYKQFCESFLAPLLLMHYGHCELGKIMTSFPNGIPLEVVKNLLPLKAKLNLQVHLHVYMQSKVSSKKSPVVENNFSKEKFLLLLNGLLDLVNKLEVKKAKSTWDDYYEETILSKHYLDAKKILVKQFTDKIDFDKVIDIGANDGVFSLLLKDKAKQIVAIDGDVNCVNELYATIRKNKIKNMIPLYASLNAPTPAIGWANEERTSLTSRLKANLVLALALVHHLAIGANVPLSFIAKWLSEMSEYLIIEFVPKSDEKVKLLLQNREDIFDEYNIAAFKNIFSEYYNFQLEERVGDTNRILFLMKIK